MLKKIEIYDKEIILRDENGNIIDRFATEQPTVEDRRGLPF